MSAIGQPNKAVVNEREIALKAFYSLGALIARAEQAGVSKDDTDSPYIDLNAALRLLLSKVYSP